MQEQVPFTGNVTMLPPPVTGGNTASVVAGANPIVVNGRTYSCALGSTISVPACDAVALNANGWSPVAWGSGPTASRPTGAFLAPGMHWYDTTVGAIIVYDGATWRNVSGAAV